MSVILISEGKLHEAKFFISRVLSGLEARVNKLSFIMKEEDIKAMSDTVIDYKELSTWVEDLFVKVYYGEFRITPSSTIEMLKLFSNLYKWISRGEMNGRYLFDLGQSLYEGGRPKIGHMMMQRGYDTSDQHTEGLVSTEIVRMRLYYDYPMVPESLLDIVEAYFNMTQYLVSSSDDFTTIDYENILDIYWPLPLIAWSDLPIMSVIREFLWRFDGGPVRTDAISQYWLYNHTYDSILDHFYDLNNNNNNAVGKSSSNGINDISENNNNKNTKTSTTSSSWLSNSKKTDAGSGDGDDNEDGYEDELIINNKKNKKNKKKKTIKLKSDTSEPISLEKESVDSYDNLIKHNHRIVNGIETIVIPPSTNTMQEKETFFKNTPIKVEVGIFGGHFNNHPVGHMVLRRILGLTSSQSSLWKDKISLTLIALPLIPDSVTKHIANQATRVVNLPIDTKQAWEIIESLFLDIIIFPDWQPFPDQQSLLFQSRRMAPIQVCFMVRGASCVSDNNDTIDYYLMPEELQNKYLKAVPAADIKSYVIPKPVENLNGRVVPNSNNNSKRPKIAHRPLWKESFSEQVILLDWPLLNTNIMHDILLTVNNDDITSQNRKSTNTNDENTKLDNAKIAAAAANNQLSEDAMIQNLQFSPLETEGQIFFEGQAVAVLPIYPMTLHPLMDDVIFKIMRAVPALHVVLAIPESYCTHAQDNKHKISWARKLVRRLWNRGGNLYHRIRLLPSPLSDHRLLQLLRQSDLVLDTFPFGIPFYFLSLAISVGTPVLTLNTGTILSTPKEDLKEIRNYIQAHKRSLKSNPLGVLLSQQDIPWLPSVSFIAGFYHSLGLESYFVANSTQQYFDIASNLTNNREYAYSLRVHLMDAIDQAKLQGFSSSSNSASTSSKSGLQLRNTFNQDESGLNDLAQFILNVGTPYARSRVWLMHRIQQFYKTSDGFGINNNNNNNNVDDKKNKNANKKKLSDKNIRDFLSLDDDNSGSIIQ